MVHLDWRSREVTAWLRKNWIHLLGAVCMVAFAAVWIRIAFLPALAADEIAFFVWADALQINTATRSMTAMLWRPNLSGYGSLYWNIYASLILYLDDQAVWVMRGGAWVAFVSIPLALAVVGSTLGRFYGWLLAALWISMPVAWWCGKVTGPDTYAMAAGVHGLLLLFVSTRPTEENAETPQLAGASRGWSSRLDIAGWLLIGAAISLKLTMLPMAVFAILVAYRPQPDCSVWNFKPLAIYLLKATLTMAFAFVLCCPVAVLDTAEFVKQLNAVPNGTIWNWDTARLALSNEAWAWDGVFSGGLVQWSLVPVAFAIWMLAMAIASPRVLLWVSLSFLVCWSMIVSKGALLGWYWFGWLPVIVVCLLWALRQSQHRQVIGSMLFVMVLLNAWQQGSSIVDRFEMKAEHVRALQELPELQQELALATADREYDAVLDYWEVAYLAGLEFPPAPGMEIWQTSPPAIRRLSPIWPTFSERTDAGTAKGVLAGASRGILSDAFVRIIELGAKGTEGKSILVVQSKRLSRHQHFGDHAAFVDQQVLPKSPRGTVYTCLLDRPNTVVYELRTPAQAADLSGSQVPASSPGIRSDTVQ